LSAVYGTASLLARAVCAFGGRIHLQLCAGTGSIRGCGAQRPIRIGAVDGRGGGGAGHGRLVVRAGGLSSDSMGRGKRRKPNARLGARNKADGDKCLSVERADRCCGAKKVVAGYEVAGR
jgi:hypothetical protein